MSQPLDPKVFDCENIVLEEIVNVNLTTTIFFITLIEVFML